MFNKGDILWVIIIMTVVLFIVSPLTHETFLTFTSKHYYMAGFIKFSILATMGELLAIRISKRNWIISKGTSYKAVMWGVYGIMITFVFTLFSGGVTVAMSKEYLPFNGSNLAFAFFTSTFMNIYFAPTFMTMHKLSDTYINLQIEGKISKVRFEDVLNEADWMTFTKFVLLKTIPLFWIPVHTLTFLAPEEYRIVISAFLSIALGVILASTSTTKSNKKGGDLVILAK